MDSEAVRLLVVNSREPAPNPDPEPIEASKKKVYSGVLLNSCTGMPVHGLGVAGM
jgi:hypothetical protein